MDWLFLRLAFPKKAASAWQTGFGGVNFLTNDEESRHYWENGGQKEEKGNGQPSRERCASRNEK